ncbi:MAG: TrbI/VirB10 family protein [Caulobacteraceae bacterium]|nr:TrbI/VirB10 family protein [Caulobacteraceae bacterium]
MTTTARMADDGKPGRNGPGGAPDLRLRGERPRVTRLSPKVLIGLASVGALGIGAAVGYGLQGGRKAAERSQPPAVENQPVADALAGLPKDYAGAPAQTPQLGPPLPGDLGRPLLAAGVAPPPMAGPAASPTPDPETQRVVQESDSARTSRIFTRGVQDAPAPALAPASGATGGDAAASPTAAAVQTTQDHKLAFLAGAAATPVVSDQRLQATVSPYLVQAGAVIPAALTTGIRSDLPGMVTAQVTEPVYDSLTGRILLIPQGSKLIGQYDSAVAFGQSRVLLVWTRLILPSGASIVLDRLPGADAQGYAGLEDHVDYHWSQLFKAAALSTLLSVGAEAGTSASENNLAQAIRMGASDAVSQAGQQIVQRGLNIEPTLTVRPGFPVRVMVTRDLVLAPYPEKASP